MKNKSCLRGCHFTLLVMLFFPSCAYMLLSLYGKFHTYNRTFVADIKSVGYKIAFTEIEHDSILSFCFNQKGYNKKKTTLFVYNNAWDVVSFIFTKDTILVRDELKLCELLYPNKKFDKQSFHSKNSIKNKLIKGHMPSNCKIIPFSDSFYFYYDKRKGKYSLRDSTIHVIQLIHDVERTNTYRLIDETSRDTSIIELHKK